jgi:archaellum component FlaC
VFETIIAPHGWPRLTEVILASTGSYKAITILEDLKRIQTSRTAPDAQSESAQKALRNAVADAQKNRAKLDDTIKEAVADTKKKRSKMERVVTELDRQKAEKTLPKNINQQIKAVKREIGELAKAADDSALEFASANKQLLGRWMAVAEQLLHDRAATKALQRESEVVNSTQGATQKAIDEMYEDASAMDDLLRHMKGIMDGAAKSAKAGTELSNRIEEIEVECKKVDTLIEDCRKLEKEAKPLLGSNKMLDVKASKKAGDGISQMGDKLQQARKELEKVEKAWNLLEKTVKLNYPKLVPELPQGDKDPIKIRQKQIEKFVQAERKFIADWKKLKAKL